MVVNQKGDSEWGTVYMLVIAAIAAVLLLTIVKPMFNEKQTLQVTQPKVETQVSQVPVTNYAIPTDSTNKQVPVDNSSTDSGGT